MKERKYEKKELPKDTESLSALVSSYGGRFVRITDSRRKTIEGRLYASKKDPCYSPHFYGIQKNRRVDYHPYRDIRVFRVDIGDGGRP